MAFCGGVRLCSYTATSYHESHEILPDDEWAAIDGTHPRSQFVAAGSRDITAAVERNVREDRKSGTNLVQNAASRLRVRQIIVKTLNEFWRRRFQTPASNGYAMHQ